MKKTVAAILILAFSAVSMARAGAFCLIQQKAAQQQTKQVKKSVHKKHRTAQRSVKGKSARIQLQLKQAQKHLAEEQKVEQTQRELKRDTTVRQP